jgi:hypothetical protein
MLPMKNGVWRSTAKHDTLMGRLCGRLLSFQWSMLIPTAIYRFTRTTKLTYYQASRTPSGIDYLSPVSVDGSEIINRHASGRRYIILYFVTESNALAAGGYWVDGDEPFAHVYVTDATVADLELVAEEIAALPTVDRRLDDVLHRHDIQVDMDVWGNLLNDLGK